jgi:beta-xylosidase
MLKLIACLLAALSLPAADSYLFTSFRGNGEDGVYFAVSDDGLKWAPLNHNQPVIKPGHPGMLMRDPCIARGPDGVFHMVWTSSWAKTGGQVRIGYASSKDLVNWSEQKLIPVMPAEPSAVNAWAPELLWDGKKGEWLILWATTIPGRYSSTDHEVESPDRNHRIYSISTRDFKTFSDARLFFDPGFNVIDSTVIEDNGRYIMFFKDERLKPVKKNIRMAFAKSAGGPYTDITDPFTRDWVEGPTAIRIGPYYYVYFDSYRKPQHYEAMRSRDLKTWEDITSRLSVPADHRHGTVIRIPDSLARSLAARYPKK